ncbi:RNA polymerase sigma factor [Streptomyces alanosinicus]|nr:RNA polymerase sigma factor [Streptomyces alanosinicus]
MEQKAEHLTDLVARDLDAGFTELVRIHGGAVHSFLHRVCGSRSDADDLGQETFLRAYSALLRYSAQRRRDLRLRAWLMTIAMNVWRNHVRSSHRRPESLLQLDDSDEMCASDRPGPEEFASHADDRRRLIAALAELSEKHRISVVLRHVVGMSYAEVAEVQGCPVGTAKAQVSRAVGELRQLLAAAAVPSRGLSR